MSVSVAGHPCIRVGIALLWLFCLCGLLLPPNAVAQPQCSEVTSTKLLPPECNLPINLAMIFLGESTMSNETLAQSDLDEMDRRKLQRQLLSGLGALVAAITLLAIVVKLWRVRKGIVRHWNRARNGIVRYWHSARARGVPRWLLRDLRQATIIALGVFVALAGWSWLR